MDMLSHPIPIPGWFLLVLCVLFLAPVMMIFFIPYTRRYNNTDKQWIRKYALCFSINTVAYLIVLLVDVLPVKVAYYYVSVGCSLYIAYMELFVRLIGRQQVKEMKDGSLVGLCGDMVVTMGVVSEEPHGSGLTDAATVKPPQLLALSERITLHMETTSDFRNPDLSLAMLAAALCTNRTTLTLALHELGYPSFNAYVNTLRIEDFIRRIRNKESANYQEAFYDAGFRSRATALRNFKQYTGKTPSAYFAG